MQVNINDMNYLQQAFEVLSNHDYDLSLDNNCADSAKIYSLFHSESNCDIHDARASCTLAFLHWQYSKMADTLGNGEVIIENSLATRIHSKIFDLGGY